MATFTPTSPSSPSGQFQQRPSSRYTFADPNVQQSVGGVRAAIDTLSGKPVCVRLLPHSFRTREAREALKSRAVKLSAVHHPRVARLLDHGYHFGMGFLVYEPVGAVTLADYLQARGPMAWASFAPIFEALLDALIATHPLVHGGIDPSAIALRGGKYVEDAVLFGHGFPDVDHAAPGSEVDQTRHAASFSTSAPELLLRLPCDHRLDLHGLACTVYHALTGAPPFATASVSGVFSAIYEAPRPLPELLPRGHGIPAGVINLIGQMLQKSPADRPDSAEEVMRLLHLAAPMADFSFATAKLRMPRAAVAARSAAESSDIEAAKPKQKAPVAEVREHSSERTINLRKVVWEKKPAPAPVRAKSVSLNPSRVALEVVLLIAVLLTFVALGWVIVIRLLGPNPQPAPVQSPPVATFEPQRAEAEVQLLFEQIGEALDQERYGAADTLLMRLEERGDFPPELSGTLRAYRSRLDMASKLNRAKRLEGAGQVEEALLIYSELSERYPHHVKVPEKVAAMKGTFVLEVHANVRGVVSVDGEPIGVTPFLGLVHVDAKQVSVARPGHRSWSTAVAAQEGARLALDARLQRRGRGEKPGRHEIDLDASPFMDLMEMRLER